jgi:putrescine aminotransferase
MCGVAAMMVGIDFNQPGGLASKVSFGLAGKLSEEYLAAGGGRINE